MKYPLLENAFSNQDIKKGIQVLKTKYITMSEKTRKFEKTFAQKNQSNYALMCNSGSSANLLMVAAACNPIRKKRLKKNDGNNSFRVLVYFFVAFIAIRTKTCVCGCRYKNSKYRY